MAALNLVNKSMKWCSYLRSRMRRDKMMIAKRETIQRVKTDAKTGTQRAFALPVPRLVWRRAMKVIEFILLFGE